MKLSVIIPVHNERATIDEVIGLVREVSLEGLDREIIVVDDASTDGTAERLRKYGRQPDVKLLAHESNRGKGAAIRTGLESATGDIVIIQDADLEYDPADYPSMLRPIMNGSADVVFGSRFRGTCRNMALANRIANRILAWAASLLFFKRITDEATCYKAFRTEILRSFDLECERFEFCPEVTAKTLRRGYRLVEVPIHYEARTVEAGKKIRATDGLEAVWTLLRYRFRR